MIVRGVHKLLELRVGYRIFVDPKCFQLHPVLMIAARRIFPGILNVHSDIVRTFDLDAADLEKEIARRNLYHAVRRRYRRFGVRYFHKLLRHGFHSCEKLSSGLDESTAIFFMSSLTLAEGGAWVARMAPYPFSSIQKLKTTCPSWRSGLTSTP